MTEKEVKEDNKENNFQVSSVSFDIFKDLTKSLVGEHVNAKQVLVSVEKQRLEIAQKQAKDNNKKVPKKPPTQSNRMK